MRCQNENNDSWAICFLTDPVDPQAVSVYTYKLVNIGNKPGQGVFIGFAPWDHPTGESIGGSNQSYALYRNDGDLYHTSSWTNYARDMRQDPTGDIIKAQIDTIWGVISYTVNDKNYGPAYTQDWLKGIKNLFPACSLRTNGDIIEFIGMEVL